MIVWYGILSDITIIYILFWKENKFEKYFVMMVNWNIFETKTPRKIPNRVDDVVVVVDVDVVVHVDVIFALILNRGNFNTIQNCKKEQCSL